MVSVFKKVLYGGLGLSIASLSFTLYKIVVFKHTSDIANVLTLTSFFLDMGMFSAFLWLTERWLNVLERYLYNKEDK